MNLEDIEYVAKVYEKGSDKILQQSRLTGHRMAPNSSFTFIIDGEKQGFQAGNYKIQLTAKSYATNQEWKWDKELEITKMKQKNCYI